MNRMQVQVDYRGLVMSITVEADDHIDTSAEDLARCAMGFLGAELEADEPKLVESRPDESRVSAEYRKDMETRLADLIMEQEHARSMGRGTNLLREGKFIGTVWAVRSMGGYELTSLNEDWARKILQGLPA